MYILREYERSLHAASDADQSPIESSLRKVVERGREGERAKEREEDKPSGELGA